VESLQTDTKEYPAWVTERYLQLPETLPQRVAELANQIAAPYTNPYDKALAIESYLRQYRYTTDIAAPPEGTDAVDYFLFDIKRGYCDYYASAMAVMLRALGIPSRLAAGYAPGELLPSQDDKPVVTDTYRVLERDAHAWVEVFFPAYGWVQFEPTAAQPQLLRPVAATSLGPEMTPTPLADEEDLRDLRNTNNSETTPLSARPESTFVRWAKLHRSALAAVTALLVLAAAIALLARWRRQAFLRSPELLANLFALVGNWATRLRIPWPASDTPLERATRFGRRIPRAHAVVYETAGLFVAQRYGRQRPSAAALLSLAREWQGLQPTLWKQWLRQVLPMRATTAPSEPQAPAGRVPQHWDPEQAQPSGTSRRH
jgi:hypothetical protein